LRVVAADLPGLNIDDLGSQLKFRVLQLLEIREALEGKDDKKENDQAYQSKGSQPKSPGVFVKGRFRLGHSAKIRKGRSSNEKIYRKLVSFSHSKAGIGSRPVNPQSQEPIPVGKLKDRF